MVVRCGGGGGGPLLKERESKSLFDAKTQRSERGERDTKAKFDR